MLNTSVAANESVVKAVLRSALRAEYVCFDLDDDFPRPRALARPRTVAQTKNGWRLSAPRRKRLFTAWRSVTDRFITPKTMNVGQFLMWICTNFNYTWGVNYTTTIRRAQGS